MEVLQVPTELDRMVAVYRQKRPKRVLEIGCWDGGTLREWLRNGWPEMVVAVDLEHKNQEAYSDWVPGWCKFVPIMGDSTSDETKELVAKYGPYDWAFIDGDHEYESASSDWQTCLENAAPDAVIAFHDIERGINVPGIGPAVLFKEIEESNKYRTERIVERPTNWNYGGEEALWEWQHGIGIVYL